jgi:hypothetical protein
LSAHHPQHPYITYQLPPSLHTNSPVNKKHSPHPAQIALLPDNDTTHLLYPLEIQDLVVQRLDHLKGLAARDRVDEDVPVDPYCVFVVEEGVFVLRTVKVDSERRMIRTGKRSEEEFCDKISDLLLVRFIIR